MPERFQVEDLCPSVHAYCGTLCFSSALYFMLERLRLINASSEPITLGSNVYICAIKLVN